MDNHTRVSDLTVEELLMLIRNAVREELKQVHHIEPINQMALLDLPPLHVGQWPEGLKLLGREEFYDDER